MFAKHSLPGFLAYSGDEVAENDDLVVQVSVELALFCSVRLKSRGIYTWESGTLVVAKWEAQGDDAVRVTGWKVLNLG